MYKVCKHSDAGQKADVPYFANSGLVSVAGTCPQDAGLIPEEPYATGAAPIAYVSGRVWNHLDSESEITMVWSEKKVRFPACSVAGVADNVYPLSVPVRVTL